MTPGADSLAYAPQSVPPPGETLQETLDELGIPQADLARRTGLTTKHINQVIQGTAALSPDTAVRLERVTGVPASLWSSLEAAWRTHLARKKEDEELAEHVDWLARFPLADLVKHRILPSRDKTVANLRRLLDFFGVASPGVAEDLWQSYRTAFRRSTVLSPDEYATATWLRMAEHRARDRVTQPHDRAKLTALLPRLRALTTQDQQIWEQELPRLCAEAGVAVVFVPVLGKTRVSGATRWLTPEKVMIALSDRFKKDDQFWFTLFHELGHILLHGKRLTFMDDTENLSTARPHEDPSEEEANDFAASTLIPAPYAVAYQQLRSKPTPFNRIHAFARAAGIAPGIVVGRLQHDGALPWSHGNALKRTITLT